MGYPKYQDFGGRRDNTKHQRYEDTGRGIEKLVNAIKSGEFSQVRSSLPSIRKQLSQRSSKVLASLKKELRENRFSQWNELDLVRNAALVAAVAVASDLRTTQIRKIIEMVKGLHLQIETSPESEELKLKGKIKAEAIHMNVLMAYYAGKNYSILPLQEILEPILIWLAQNPSRENFKKVYAFFEAIVAYHRYFGGKE